MAEAPDAWLGTTGKSCEGPGASDGRDHKRIGFEVADDAIRRMASRDSMPDTAAVGGMKRASGGVLAGAEGGSESADGA